MRNARRFSAFRTAWKGLRERYPVSPLTSNILTAGGLFLAGDVLCQGIEYTQHPSFRKGKAVAAEEEAAAAVELEEAWRFDPARAFRMMAFGVCVLGPLGHYWYRYLDRVFPGTSVREVVKKVFLDEFCMNPPYLLSFFLFMSLLEGHNRQEATDRLKKEFWPTYTLDIAIWCPAAAINFLFVPPTHRVLYVSGISVFWNAWLSFVSNKDSAEKKQQERAERVKVLQ